MRRRPGLKVRQRRLIGILQFHGRLLLREAETQKL